MSATLGELFRTVSVASSTRFHCRGLLYTSLVALIVPFLLYGYVSISYPDNIQTCRSVGKMLACPLPPRPDTFPNLHPNVPGRAFCSHFWLS